MQIINNFKEYFILKLGMYQPAKPSKNTRIIDPIQHGNTKHISKQLFAPLSASKECMTLQLMRFHSQSFGIY